MDALAAEFGPLFRRIAEGAAEREASRTLPHEQMRWLKEAGFTALRVPAESGGRDVGYRESIALLIDLAAADPNLAQALRSHLSLVEFHRTEPQGALSEWFLREAGAGRTFGDAARERDFALGGGYRTRIEERDGGARVDGEKFYCTGTLFADYVVVAAGYRDEASVYAVVDAGAPGLERLDDWNGFGQRLTASGTTRFADVPLARPEVFRFGGATESFMTAQFQLVLLACLGCVAKAGS